MKKLQDQLKVLAISLKDLSMQVEKIANQIEVLQSSKAGVEKTANPMEVQSSEAGSAKNGKMPIIKTPAAKNKTAIRQTVIGSVLDVIRKSRKGVTVDALRKKTGLNPKQLSNSLYKLSQRGKITTVERGLYIKK